MKRIIVILLCAIIVLAVASGCGRSDTNGTEINNPDDGFGTEVEM